ncbi:MAG TPA: hypothetical protein VME67_09780 [Mycobacterium sp.]|nr:hypothetical protein [Mycobacterium sp.]HTX95099.1 hypothetical protein [Mycobacterium sp.]
MPRQFEMTDEQEAALAALLAQPRLTPPGYRCPGCEQFHDVSPCFPGCATERKTA